MVDEVIPGDGETVSICPWCSAPYSGDREDCPSCGATLGGDVAPDASLPGLTAIDASAIVRGKEPPKRQRNRFLSWLSGDYPEEATSPANSTALARPDDEVRREMLRLELEAEVARLQAEANALAAEAAAEGRAPAASPEDAAAAEAVEDQLDEIEEELDEIEAELEADPPAETTTDAASEGPAQAVTDPPAQPA
jgi:hypothetical protein